MSPVESWNEIRRVLEDADEPLTARAISERVERPLPTGNPPNYVRTILWRHRTEVRRYGSAYFLAESDLADCIAIERTSWPNKLYLEELFRD